MNRKHFSVEQIVAVLKQTELGMPVSNIIQQVTIAEQTFYRWKKLVAELGLGKAMLQDVATKKWEGPRAEARSGLLSGQPLPRACVGPVR